MHWSEEPLMKHQEVIYSPKSREAQIENRTKMYGESAKKTKNIFIFKSVSVFGHISRQVNIISKWTPFFTFIKHVFFFGLIGKRFQVHIIKCVKIYQFAL